MAYTIRPYQVQYFGENQWAETPSEMLSPLLVQTLQNTKHYRAVVSAPYSGIYNYALSTRILRFEQDYMHKPHAFKLTARVSINRMSNNQLVAAKEFVISTPISNQSPYGGVIAANNATRQLMREIAKFSLQNT
jgi:cholesterol transport system auxiliary component